MPFYVFKLINHLDVKTCVAPSKGFTFSPFRRFAPVREVQCFSAQMSTLPALVP